MCSTCAWLKRAGYVRDPREGGLDALSVLPAKAGPSCLESSMDPRLRGDDEQRGTASPRHRVSAKVFLYRRWI
jgi:hypothetical protein